MSDLLFPKPKKILRETKPLKARRYSHTIVRKGHEFLNGKLAHFRRRVEVYRACGGRIEVIDDSADPPEFQELEPARCGLCVEPHLVWFTEGHWVHLEKRHCDCVACTTFACKVAHSHIHHDDGRIFL
jgi:hypothetical protein